ncbi:MAG: peptidase S8 [Lachnospiraceae bacterium]|nr:peptidase S8 [Lachnospiraceae bacterium]
MEIFYGDILKELRNIDYTGNGMGVAVFDSGVYEHIDLYNRIVASVDCTGDKVSFDRYLYDVYGHGTHIAGIIAGGGYGCNGRFRGIAPEADIISVRILDKKGKGNIKNVIKGVKWIIENKERYNIAVANFSIGSAMELDDEQKKMQFHFAVKDLVDSGIIVVAAAGNNGPGDGTITMPGIFREVITVGSSDDNVPILVDGRKGVVKNYSGRGNENYLYFKPDITAPGSNIPSCRNSGTGYVIKSGTSMSAAILSGIITLYLEIHGKCSQEYIRERLCHTAYDGGRPKNVQGCGIVNVSKFLH